MKRTRGPDVAVPGWSSVTSPGTFRAAKGPSLARVAGWPGTEEEKTLLGEEGLLTSAGFFPSLSGGLFLHTFVYSPTKLINCCCSPVCLPFFFFFLTSGYSFIRCDN